MRPIDWSGVIETRFLLTFLKGLYTESFPSPEGTGQSESFHLSSGAQGRV